MKQQEIVEKIIIDIRKKKYKVGDKIPTEKELIEQFFCSKETVRKAIRQLVDKNFLFSLQGKGVFVSQFFNFEFNLRTIKDEARLATFSRHPINYKIPKIVKENFPFNFNYESKKSLKYIKLYFKGDKTIFYTINWILTENILNLTEKELLNNGKRKIFECKLIKKIYQKNILTKPTKFDRFLFNDNNEYYPTTFNYYFDKNEKLIGISLIKIFPNYYQNEQIKKMDNNK
ncbi:/ yvoA / HTH-type transcriptional repressor yvoA /:462562 Reverse [Candidatus Hepatoplasma crinochetorum]|uniref:/ yvoA / HTH-type transcriptional repressor yvoA /:462562 Reverse n=1 Tax=Candidatus Hepatoplasma crinochetorum TaxID=295596 RepID=A0A0G7ZN79_9MOLU|nr:/ yvoA / HTH-type transcriptional repressor yvoA /:462562 Reverse [Candidatus Hepatoplasma crinochetorum]